MLLGIPPNGADPDAAIASRGAEAAPTLAETVHDKIGIRYSVFGVQWQTRRTGPVCPPTGVCPCNFAPLC
jgi:hypothetical protein